MIHDESDSTPARSSALLLSKKVRAKRPTKGIESAQAAITDSSSPVNSITRLSYSMYTATFEEESKTSSLRRTSKHEHRISSASDFHFNENIVEDGVIDEVDWNVVLSSLQVRCIGIPVQ